MAAMVEDILESTDVYNYSTQTISGGAGHKFRKKLKNSLHHVKKSG